MDTTARLKDVTYKATGCSQNDGFDPSNRFAVLGESGNASDVPPTGILKNKAPAKSQKAEETLLNIQQRLANVGVKDVDNVAIVSEINTVAMRLLDKAENREWGQYSKEDDLSDLRPLEQGLLYGRK